MLVKGMGGWFGSRDSVPCPALSGKQSHRKWRSTWERIIRGKGQQGMASRSRIENGDWIGDG